MHRTLRTRFTGGDYANAKNAAMQRPARNRLVSEMLRGETTFIIKLISGLPEILKEMECVLAPDGGAGSGRTRMRWRLAGVGGRGVGPYPPTTSCAATAGPSKTRAPAGAGGQYAYNGRRTADPLHRPSSNRYQIHGIRPELTLVGRPSNRRASPLKDNYFLL